MTIQTLILLTVLVGLSSTASPFDEAIFLRKIVNQYSPSLALSFLQTRINNNKKMITKLKGSVAHMDQSATDLFDLQEQFHVILDKQIAGLQKADYFATNGTEKVKYFIEQFILQNELYPIKFTSSAINQVTPDNLLEQLSIKSSAKLVNETHTLIEGYLSDIDGKESQIEANQVQKLYSSLTKKKLQLLLDHVYSNDDTTRKTEIEANLKKVKIIIDLFYHQYNQLSDDQRQLNVPETSHSKWEAVTEQYWRKK